MIKILAYFVPFAVNFLSGGFFFISAFRFAITGYPRTVVAASVTAWGMSYCLTTFILGKKIKTSNALPLVLAGGISLMAASGGFMIFTGEMTQILWLIIAGIGAALFCAPFQLFARSIETGKSQSPGTIKATSFYTLTWSWGFASGPLVFAWIGARYTLGFLVTLGMSFLVTLSVIIIGLLSPKKVSPVQPEAETEEVKENLPRRFPENSYTKLAILGWIVGGLGTVTVSQLRALWPKLGEDYSISREHIAYILALASYVQGFTALLLSRSKCWMWKRLPALLMSVSGICGLLLFAFCRSQSLFYLASILYGIYSGCLYFYMVYHSLSHPSRSGFFVAGNEIIVGVTSMLAPLAGGFLADIFHITGAAFIFAAVSTLIALIFQLLMLNPVKLAEGK